jgi:cation transport ATPase
MRYTLLVLVIALGLCGVADADTIQATVNGMVCGFCATGIEKTFRAQPEVKAVDVDLENNLVTIQTKQGRTTRKSRSCSAMPGIRSRELRDKNNESANFRSRSAYGAQFAQHFGLLRSACIARVAWRGRCSGQRRHCGATAGLAF